MQSTLDGISEKADPADRYYEWSWKRYQQRILRLTLALVLFAALALVVIALLGLRIRDLEATRAADLDRVGALERQVQVLNERPATKTTARVAPSPALLARQRCLENTIQRMNQGLRLVMHRRITAAQYLDTYKFPPCN